jgi:hypothetical protein
MEINYDIIIKYLTKSVNNFSNKKHILTYIENMNNKFSSLLQNKFYKYGITNVDDKNINISFNMSLLTLINKTFLSLSQKEELEGLNIFKEFLNNKLNSFTPSNYLLLELEKNKLKTTDLTNNIDNLYFQYIVEILNINLLIFDFENEEIYSMYPDQKLNPWKPILLLAKYKDWWEPIINEIKSKRLFSYNDNQIKKILNENKIKYYLNTREYKINDNLMDIINDLKPKDNIHVNKKEDSNETFIKCENNENELNKLTKNQLSDMCKSKNIKITTKMLKKELIDLILNN